MKAWLSAIEEAIWPRGVKCLCCDTLSEGRFLCMDCAKALDTIRIDTEELVSRHVCSVYRYDGVAKELVLLLKEEGVEDASKVLAVGLAETVKKMNLPPETILTWVTMPDDRKRRRWIDHGKQLCEDVGRLTGLPVKQLLTRMGRLHTQRGLNREERLSNLSGSIACREALTSPVMVIDDVYTTGATVSACRAALIAAGATQVYALTATRTLAADKQNDNMKG